MKKLLIIGVCLALAIAFVGCKEKKPAEKAADAVKNAAGAVEKEAGKAADDVKKAVE